MALELPDGVNITSLLSALQGGNLTQLTGILPPHILAMVLETLNGTIPSQVILSDNSSVVVSHSTYVLNKGDVAYRWKLIQAYGIIMLIASIAGLLGNGLVITVYLKKLKDLSVVKLLILHLAVADFIFSISQMVLAVPSVKLSGWEYGEPACKFIHSCLLLGSLIAVGTMLIIAIERYYSIVRALTYTNQKRRVMVLIISIWIAASASTTPSIIALRLTKNGGECKEFWNQSGLSRTGEIFYEFYLLFVWFLIPMAIISFCYISIINLLKQPLEKRGLNAWNVSPKYFSKRKKEDMKAVRVSMAVVCAFFICCFPVRLLWVVLKFINANALPDKSYFALMYAGLLPYPLHVAANPLIYSLIDKIFRKDVHNLFRGKKRLRTTSTRDANGHRLSLTVKSLCPQSGEGSPDDETRLRSLALLLRKS